MATFGKPNAAPGCALHNSAALASSDAALELEGVTRDFAVGWRGLRLRALDRLNLRIERGQVYGLLGPNGSGKSTTLKIILGLLEPTAGRCTVFGIPSDRVEARRMIGYLPESPYFYGYLTGRELVRFYGRMSGLKGARLAARVDEVIAWTGLEAGADRRVETYSKGMLQRIGLAQALVHDPELVILDEPTAGLDPAGVEAVTELILNLKDEGKTVLITSHLLAQIEEVCDRIAILDRGRLIVECAVSDLPPSDEQMLVVSKLPAGELVELRAWLAARGRTIESVGPPRARLDEIFLQQAARPWNDGPGRRDMNGEAFSPRRLVFIALNTLREAVRQRILSFLLLLALIVVLGAQYLRDFHFGSPELKFIADLGFGTIAGFGTVLAVVLTAQLFFHEVEHRTVLTLLAKPVGRAEFILGKFLGSAAIIAVFCGMLTILLAGVLWTREGSLMREYPEAFAGGRVIDYAHVVAGGLLQWLKLLVLAALTLLIASYARTQLFAVVMGFVIFVICHLQYLAREIGERAGNSVTGIAAGLVGLVFPNFQLFTFADARWNGDFPWGTSWAGGALCLGLRRGGVRAGGVQFSSP